MNDKNLKKIRDVFSNEDLVIITVIAAGFLASAVIFIFRLGIPPIITAVLLGTAVSALVYRFLGGIHVDTSFAVGALKVSGTMAALIGCAYFINGQLEKQIQHNMDQLFTPHVNTWFAVDKSTGAPLQVRVTGAGKIALPDSESVVHIPLTLRPDGDSWLVLSRQNSQIPLGSLSENDLKNAGVAVDFNSQLNNFVVTDRLPPGTVNYHLDPLPFKLHTQQFNQDYSHFSLISSSGDTLYNGSIYRKQAQILSINTSWYLVAVVEVNHLPADGHPYAKFAIGEIIAEID